VENSYVTSIIWFRRPDIDGGKNVYASMDFFVLPLALPAAHVPVANVVP
jgi:hypothetical protein